jgi:hypothetical protein
MGGESAAMGGEVAARWRGGAPVAAQARGADGRRGSWRWRRRRRRRRGGSAMALPAEACTSQCSVKQNTVTLRHKYKTQVEIQIWAKNVLAA